MVKISPAHGFAALSIVLQASVPVAIKFVPADPYVIGVVRLVFGALIVGLAVKWKKEWDTLSAADRWMMFFIGLSFGLHWLSFFFSIKIGTAQMAALGVSTYGVLVSVAGAIFLKHRFGMRHVVALCLAITGSICIGGGTKAGISQSHLIGFALGVVAAGFFTVLPILHQKSNHISLGLRTFSQYGFGMVVFVPLAPLGDWSIVVPAFWGLLYLVLIGTIVAHTLWIYATTQLNTATASLIYYIYPPSAVTFAFLVLGETLSGLQMIGVGFIILSGLWTVLGKALDRAFRKAK